VLVINVMGRTYMDPLDDPFAAVERSFPPCPLREGADAIVVDMHAEATSEKMAMGQFCDGRVSCVVGTHSHVPTADAQVLPHGNAYQTDAGSLCRLRFRHRHGQFEPLQRFTKKMPDGPHMTPANGPATLCAVFVETDRLTGLAMRAEPVRVGGRLIPTTPFV
jgi:calcineurin-like phosphoesterase